MAYCQLKLSVSCLLGGFKAADKIWYEGCARYIWSDSHPGERISNEFRDKCRMLVGVPKFSSLS